MRTLIIAVAGAGLAGVAPAAERDALAGRTAGPPVDCISTARLDGPDIIDNRTILYRESRRRIWRNDLPAICPGLHPTATLIVERFGYQLCHDDHVRPVDRESPIPGPICRLGKFTPYDLPK